MFAGDFAFVGDDAPVVVSTVDLLNRGHRGVAVNFRAKIARAFCQRGGQIAGLNVAVLGVLNRADQSLGVAHRPDLADLLRREEIDGDADGFADAGVVAVFVHAVLGASEADVADLAKPDRLAGLALQILVEPHRILVEFADRVTHVEKRQQPGGVPGGAGSQFLALHQHDITPALFGKVVERARADHAAADDHDFCFVFHGGFSEGIFCGCFKRRFSAGIFAGVFSQGFFGRWRIVAVKKYARENCNLKWPGAAKSCAI